MQLCGYAVKMVSILVIYRFVSGYENSELTGWIFEGGLLNIFKKLIANSRHNVVDCQIPLLQNYFPDINIRTIRNPDDIKPFC
jgi:hypothetical protein